MQCETRSLLNTIVVVLSDNMMRDVTEGRVD